MAKLVESSRLVTVTGPPGIGKSRLAVEVARKLAERYPDGVWLVELASVTEGACVPRAVASAVSVEEVGGQSILETLVRRLGARRLLLLLDNCEHLVGPCADVVSALLRGCLELRIVATSREALNIAGETTWQLPPLSVPDRAEQRPDALMRYGAVELFVERARAVDPSFSLRTDVAAAVAGVCQGVDGIPLAIELAAACIEALTPADIARRLDDRFSLLRRGSRGALPRHQTLHAALDWSNDLLSNPERAVLRRLSVFGGVERDALEAICGGGQVQGDQLFELLFSLVAKSLVVAETSNGPHTRYRLLETIRAYARERLDEAGETDAYRQAHAAWYLALAERAEPELTGPAQQDWFERLEEERENFRCALEWSLANGETEWALRLAGALVLFWRVRCHFSEGRDLLERVISSSNGAAPPELRAKGLWGAGFLALAAGDLGRAAPALEESLACFRELGDRSGCARALLVLGNSKQFADPAGALSLLEESAALAREGRDAWCLAHALGCSGLAHEVGSDLAAARASFEQGLAVAREAQDKQGLRFNLIGLGSAAIQQGDYRRAEGVLEEALVLSRELGEDYAEATALCDLGEVAAGRGDHWLARERFEQSLSLMRAVRPSPEELVRPLVGLAKALHAEGNHDRARQLFGEALALLPSADPVLPDALRGLGELCAEEGDLAEARHLWEKARHVAEAHGHKAGTADALYCLGQLARDDGDWGRAAALHDEALRLRHQIGDAGGMADSLEAIGGLAAVAGRYQHAARLFGAAGTLRDANGCVRPPWASRRYEADLALTNEELSAEELEAAYAQGACLSTKDAVIQASKGRGPRAQATSGWESLTDTEKQVAALVAEDLTNPEIAARLFLGLGTVKDHVSRIFSKLGVSRRRELAKEVRRRRERPASLEE